MDEANGRVNEIDRAIAEALDVAHSPDFVARVRRRVAREPKPLPFWRGWKIAVPAVAAAIMIAAGVVMLSRRTAVTPQLLPARSLSLAVLPPVPVVPAGPVTAPAVRSASRRARVETPPQVASLEPEVLVPREEIEMYRRLIAAAQQVGRAVVVDAPRDIVPPPQVAEITIDPIRIDPILPPVGGQGDRQ